MTLKKDDRMRIVKENGRPPQDCLLHCKSHRAQTLVYLPGWICSEWFTRTHCSLTLHPAARIVATHTWLDTECGMRLSSRNGRFSSWQISPTGAHENSKMVLKHLRHASINFASSLPKPVMAYIQNGTKWLQWSYLSSLLIKKNI